MSSAKTLIPNKEWIVQDSGTKIGSIARAKKGYVFLKHGNRVPVGDLADINQKFGIAIFEESLKKIRKEQPDEYFIYDFPCSSKPFEPLYSVKKKLPLFSKNLKSKSRYCAGHYVIKLKKGWIKGFCPKLITLERYPYLGPYKTEQEAKAVLEAMDQL